MGENYITAPTALKFYYSGGGTESVNFANFRNGYRNRFTMPDPQNINIDFNRALLKFRLYNSTNPSNMWNERIATTWYCTNGSYTDAANLPTKYDYKTRTYTWRACSWNNHLYSFDISEILLYAKQNYTSTWYLWSITTGTGSGDPRLYLNNSLSLEIDNEGQRSFPEFGVSAAPASGVSPYVRQGTEWKPVKEIYVYKDGVWVKSTAAVRADSEWKAGKFNSNYTDADDFSGWPSTNAEFLQYNIPDNGTTIASRGSYVNRDVTESDSTYTNANNYYLPSMMFNCEANSDVKYHGWTSANTAGDHWVMIKLPEYAYNLKVAIKNAETVWNGVNGPTAGEFYYDQGCSLLSDFNDLTPVQGDAFTFTRPNGTDINEYTVHDLNNKYPIRILGIKVTVHPVANTDYNYARIGKIKLKYDTKAEE